MNKKELAVKTGKYMSIILLLVVVLLLGSFVVTGLGQPIGESTYTGQVVDVENDVGIVFKVDTVHMRTGEDSSTTEEFCVLDDSLMNQATSDLEGGDRVVVTYHRPLFVSPTECAGDTSIATNIEVQNQPAD